jgi:hypothetical protein
VAQDAQPPVAGDDANPEVIERPFLHGSPLLVVDLGPW